MIDALYLLIGSNYQFRKNDQGKEIANDKGPFNLYDIQFTVLGFFHLLVFWQWCSILGRLFFL